MGFDETRAKRALLHFKNDINKTTDYLLCSPAEMDDTILGSGNNQIT